MVHGDECVRRDCQKKRGRDVCIYIYTYIIYIYTYIYVYTYIHMYIYIERERECVCVCTEANFQNFAPPASCGPRLSAVVQVECDVVTLRIAKVGGDVKFKNFRAGEPRDEWPSERFVTADCTLAHGRCEVLRL